MELIKRLFDIFFATIGIILLIPVFLLIAILIKREDGGSIFFVQERVGFGGKLFRLYKFRTMVVGAEKIGKQITVDGDNRITRTGKVLRKYKLDELPQLFNVIKGYMSLVGPRPEVPYYVNLYNQRQKEVLKIMPGITDPASISFYNESEILGKAKDPEKEYINNIMAQKININLNYSKNANIFKDFLIILKTLYISFFKKG